MPGHEAAAIVKLAPEVPEWTLSIVSHGHIAGVRRLLADAQRHLPIDRFEIVVTINTEERHEGLDRHWSGRLTVIRNEHCRGFSANHNAALRVATGRNFAVLDPDLRLSRNVFGDLDAILNEHEDAIASPVVHDEQGRIQDNARRVVTPLSLLRRYALGHRHRQAVTSPETRPVPWVAGLFMAVRRSTLRKLGGFDERYYLYCEDVALCMRMWNQGGTVYLVPSEGVSHVARRMTLKDWRHFGWHCSSLVAMWGSAEFWRFASRDRTLDDRTLS